MADKNQIYTQAEIVFGRKQQLVKVIEELSELTKEIAKLINADRPTKSMYDSLFEETADCEIMIEQIKQMFDAEQEVERIKQAKLKRLELIVFRKVNEKI